MQHTDSKKALYRGATEMALYPALSPLSSLFCAAALREGLDFTSRRGDNLVQAVGFPNASTAPLPHKLTLKRHAFTKEQAYG